ncbi:Chloroperoxidase [Lophiotrema nucula]|uniref:Chloroperoxidase n=1 Tax=Lophiotrema nucula TaxID=690887 RepID=A0A6A5YTY9_9PLEO|nr:Chloroperoxidase [Lophiotrema nucula]
MKLAAALSVLVGLAASNANCQIDFKNWHPPIPGDVRSPCPLLNSLANHDILPRNGKGITILKVVEALGASINVSVEIATTLGKAGLSLSANPAGGSFNLDDLNKHNAIEHDASLSRKDFNSGGDSHTFSQEIFDEYIGAFNGSTEITLPAAALARWNRVQTEQHRDPKFVYGPTQRFNSYLETVIYNLVLGNATTQRTPMEFVKIFFQEERLPFNEGWRTPQIPIDGFALSQTVLNLALLTPEKLTPFVNPSELKDFDGPHGMLFRS